MYTVVDACSAASYSSCVPENRRSLYADSLLGSLKRDAIGRKRGGGRRARFARSTEKGRRWGIFCDLRIANGTRHGPHGSVGTTGGRDLERAEKRGKK